ncbi:phosphotransferase [Siminovitchia sediminis]|uniref:Phosphotransferase n=1 Tax=Siminovitchia sediminis TaxID=1274353 RepID=A0ABW4KCK3_9BACI
MKNRRNRRRDGFSSRLLLYVRKITGIPFRNISKLKEGIWLAAAPREKWIIKEFSKPEKVYQQYLLTRLLRENGFHHTYTFHPIHQSGPCFFEKRCLGFIQFVESDNDDLFQYSHAKDRKEALALISQFHDATSKCLEAMKARLPTCDLPGKWEKRIKQFQTDIQHFKDSSAFPYLERYSRIGEYALSLMNQHSAYFYREPHCILHGDLAHHNFIRTQHGRLYIIDFDLISMGPKYIDILQYCNRISSSLDWSPKKLFSEGEEIRRYAEDLPFLAALLYPADIFREWKYLLQFDDKRRKAHWKYVKDITFLQFKKRMQYSEHLMERINK